MRSETPGTPDDPRVVIDEATFDFRGLPDKEIEDGLDQLNTTILELREKRIPPFTPPMWEDVEVLDGCELYEFLSRSHPSRVDRDTLVLSASLLGKSREWPDDGTVATEISIGEEPPSMALSAAYALSRHHSGATVACLTFRQVRRSGLLNVAAGERRGQIYFLAHSGALATFWRWRMRFEKVAEPEFLASCSVAFPQLKFHEDLSFRNFEGAYAQLRDQVLDALAVLNDHFLTAYRQGNGISSEVQAALGRHHFDVSMESVKTRASEKLMKLRDVPVGHVTYRCEWHAKLEPHRNRIHFWVPPAAGGKPILVGIFIDHLQT